MHLVSIIVSFALRCFRLFFKKIVWMTSILLGLMGKNIGAIYKKSNYLRIKLSKCLTF